MVLRCSRSVRKIGMNTRLIYDSETEERKDEMTIESRVISIDASIFLFLLLNPVKTILAVDIGHIHFIVQLYNMTIPSLYLNNINLVTRLYIHILKLRLRIQRLSIET